MNSARFLPVLVLPLVTIACGGSGGGAKSGSDVSCPEGQTFDGEFCQVDQTVATAEKPVAPEESEPEPVKQPEAEGEEEPPQEGEEVTEGEGENEPEEAKPETPKRESATPVDVTMAAQAAPLIQYMAGAHLPAGARQMGSPFAGQFAEGQILERKVQLTEGKCYTVMAAGLPPVAEVNLEIFVEGEEKEPVAKDETAGLQAVLGSRDKCFKPAKSGSYRLVLSVERGQGVAAAQVFQK